MDFDIIKERFLLYKSDQRRALITLSVIALAIAAFFALSSRSQPVHGAEQIRLTAAPVSDTSTSLIFVHVAGKVVHPGVYPMLRGSRVVDALRAVGGELATADVSEVNLARVVVDGEQIYLPSKNETLRGATHTNSHSKININRANSSLFDSLPGIGPVIAERIVQFRKEHGPFASIEDLQKVGGIGPKLFMRIKDRLSL